VDEVRPLTEAEERQVFSFRNRRRISDLLDVAGILRSDKLSLTGMVCDHTG